MVTLKFLRGRRTFHIHSYLWFVEDPISCQRVGSSEKHKEIDCKRKETVKGRKKREETGLQQWRRDVNVRGVQVVERALAVFMVLPD